MIADLVLEGPQRRIVLDTKYYRGGGATGTGGRLRSGHLYQVFAYVLNRQRARPDGPLHEGILLYPTVGKEVRVDFRTHGHRLQARSLDLSRPWREIHEQLLQLVA